jgi:hypothetical protein
MTRTFGQIPVLSDLHFETLQKSVCPFPEPVKPFVPVKEALTNQVFNFGKFFMRIFITWLQLSTNRYQNFFSRIGDFFGAQCTSNLIK